jgi:hypothetical protein
MKLLRDEFQEFCQQAIGANRQLSLADPELWLHQPKKFQVNLLPLNEQSG